jgi:transposase InsO family protein
MNYSIARRSPVELRHVWGMFEFIEGCYNPHRRHLSLGYDSPVDYERRHLAIRAHATQTFELPSATLSIEEQ